MGCLSRYVWVGSLSESWTQALITAVIHFEVIAWNDRAFLYDTCLATHRVLYALVPKFTTEWIRVVVHRASIVWHKAWHAQGVRHAETACG